MNIKSTYQGKRHKPKLHVKKGDTVMVIAGEDKGKKGRILEVFPNELRAIVEGVAIASRHTKPDAKNTQGGIVKKEASVHISKLAHVDPKSGKPTRIGRRKENGVTVRYSKKSNEVIK